MISSFSPYIPGFLSALAIIISAAFFYFLYMRVSGVEEEVDELEEDVKGLEIETRAFEDSGIEDEEDLFEENIRDLAERLFALLKTKHDVEEVTTYREMTDVLEDMDADDSELKEELLNFYESAIRLEYSDEDLSESERERMKQTAVDLIKRTGQDLEVQG